MEQGRRIGRELPTVTATTYCVPPDGPGGPADLHTTRGDSRHSLLWRISAGTLLSIGGMVLITIYQNLNGGLNEVRNDLKHLTVTSGDQVKKDELHNRITPLWTTIKELQAAKEAGAVRDGRMTYLEQQLKAGDEERRELVRQLQRLRERLATVEGRQAITPPVDPSGE